MIAKRLFPMTASVGVHEAFAREGLSTQSLGKPRQDIEVAPSLTCHRGAGGSQGAFHAEFSSRCFPGGGLEVTNFHGRTWQLQGGRRLPRQVLISPSQVVNRVWDPR
jgi:hypothetical protein